MKIQELNDVEFSDKEWIRFVEEYLDKPGDTLIDKTRKIHDNHIYDFVFDDGHIKNIYIADKQNIARNKVQVINQFEQIGTHTNRYDVTILVNAVWLSVKHSIKYTDIQKKVSTKKILFSNIFSCLSYQTVRTAVILPIRWSGTRTVSTLL